MKNIINYIYEYGNKTFEIEPFNEVDNIIFSLLSYIDFKNIIINEISIKESSKLYLKNHNITVVNTKIKKTAINIFLLISNYDRYKNLKLSNYIYKLTDDTQFSSLSIKLSDNIIYVSFEGTDEYIQGWGEDVELSYKFPIPSQMEAIKYLNDISINNNYNFIIGGHSKGGNLALTSSMYCRPTTKNRILKIYTNDSPGLRLEEFNSREYKEIKDKIINIVPNKSIVGMILYSKEPIIIKSSNINQHNPIYWYVKKNKFEKTNLSDFSNKFNTIFNNWLYNMTYLDRRNFRNILFLIISNMGIKNIKEIENDKLKYLKKSIYETKNLSFEDKQLLLIYLKRLVKEFINY